MSRRKKILMAIGGAVLAVLIGIQFVPVSRENPPAAAPFEGPGDVMAILANACYDCHSHQTVWPWYSRVAPVSWLVAHDVNHGREYLNFSNWGKLSDSERSHMAHEMVEEVEEGKMPLPIYTLIHGDAKVSEAQMQTLRAWAATVSDEGAEGAGHQHEEESGHDH